MKKYQATKFIYSNEEEQKDVLIAIAEGCGVSEIEIEYDLDYLELPPTDKYGVYYITFKFDSWGKLKKFVDTSKIYLAPKV